MKKFTKTAVATAIAAGTLAGLVGATVPASAQQKTFLQKRYNAPLTVRRRPAVVAPVAAAAGVVAAPIGIASTLVGAPFAALNTIFPAPGPRVGGPDLRPLRQFRTGIQQDRRGLRPAGAG